MSKSERCEKEHKEFTAMLKSCVSTDDVKGVVRAVLEKAKQGDVDAAQLVIRWASPCCC